MIHTIHSVVHRDEVVDGRGADRPLLVIIIIILLHYSYTSLFSITIEILI
jgi:hypothetical protein